MIVNAGGADLLDSEDVDDEKEDIIDTTAEEVEEGADEEPAPIVKKKKNKSVNYGKISVALGKSIKAGIKVLPPDINKSDLIFKPDAERNAIIYGLKGINKIGTALVYEIMSKRPYKSMDDFLARVKVNKTQMVSLIKAGVFDEFFETRYEAMNYYLDLIADKKKRITLQNMTMLISKGMIPEEYDFQRRVFNFTKYIRKFKDGDYYKLDTHAMNFYSEHYDIDKLTDVVITNESS